MPAYGMAGDKLRTLPIRVTKKVLTRPYDSIAQNGSSNQYVLPIRNITSLISIIRDYFNKKPLPGCNSSCKTGGRGGLKVGRASLAGLGT